MGCGGSNATGTVFPGDTAPKQGDSPNPDDYDAQAAAKAGLQRPLSTPLLASLQAQHRALLAASEGAPKRPPSNEPPTNFRMQGDRTTIRDIDKTELAARQLDVRRQLDGSMATVLRRRRTSVAEVYHLLMTESLCLTRAISSSMMSLSISVAEVCIPHPK